jgi:hypothetical protein
MQQRKCTFAIEPVPAKNLFFVGFNFFLNYNFLCFAAKGEDRMRFIIERC